MPVKKSNPFVIVLTLLAVLTSVASVAVVSAADDVKDKPSESRPIVKAVAVGEKGSSSKADERPSKSTTPSVKKKPIKARRAKVAPKASLKTIPTGAEAPKKAVVDDKAKGDAAKGVKAVTQPDVSDGEKAGKGGRQGANKPKNDVNVPVGNTDEKKNDVADKKPKPIANIRFQFDGIEYKDVIKRFAAMVGKPILGDVDVEGKLTFFDAIPYTYDDAYDTLNLILAMQGYQLMESGRFLRVVAISDISQMPLKIFKGVDKVTGVRPGEIVTVVVPVKNINAESAAKAVLPMVSTFGKISPLARGNGILITDRLASIKRIRTLLDAMDDQVTEKTKLEMKTYQLKHASAVSVVNVVNMLLSMSPPTSSKRSSSSSGSTGKGVIRAQADVTSNLVIVRGTKDMLVLADQLITMMDKEGGTSSVDIRVFGLKTAGARDVAQALTVMFGSSRTPSGQRSYFYGDTSMNSVFVRTSIDQMPKIEKMVRELDQNVKEIHIVRAFRLKTAQAASLVAVFQNALKRRDARGSTPTASFTVTADSVTNTLYISGSKALIDTASKMVEDIDKDIISSEREIHIVKLKDTDVATLASTLSNMYAQSMGKGTPASAKPYIQALTASDSLLVSCTADQWTKIQQLIDQVKAAVIADGGQVTRIVALKNAKAEELAKTLSSVFSGRPTTTRRVTTTRPPTSSSRTISRSSSSSKTPRPVVAPTPQILIVPSVPNNSLVITATASDHERVGAVIKTLDVPAKEKVDPIQMIQLKSGDATRVATTLKGLIPSTSRQTVLISPDTLSNSVLIRAPESERKMVEELIAKLDEITKEEIRELRIFILKHVRAREMSTMLNQLFGTGRQSNPYSRYSSYSPYSSRYSSYSRYSSSSSSSTLRLSGRESDPSQRVVVAPGPGDRMLVIEAPKARMAEIEKMIQSLDIASPDKADPIHIVRLKSADAARLATTLKAMLPKPRSGEATDVFIEADTTTNSVLVRAPESERAMIEKMIQKLDDSTKEHIREMRIIQLKHVSVAAMLPMLQQLYAAPSTSSSRSSSYYPYSSYSSSRYSSYLSSRYSSSSSRNRSQTNPAERIILAAAPGDRTLVIEAPRDKIEEIVKLVESLDVKGGAATQQVYTYDLKRANAVELAASLTRLFSKGGRSSSSSIYSSRSSSTKKPGEPEPPRFDASGETNQLLVSATPAQLEEIEKVIRDVERSSQLISQTRTYRLQFARATDIVQVIQQMLDGQGASSSRRSSSSYSSSGKTSKPPVRVAALATTNDIIVQGPPDKLALAEQLIKTFDTKEATSQVVIQVVKLKNAQAVSLAKAVTAVMNAKKSTSDRSSTPNFIFNRWGGLERAQSNDKKPASGDQVMVTAEPNSNSILVRGPTAQVAETVKMIEKLDSQSNATQAQVKVFRIKDGDATSLATSLGDLFKDMIKNQVTANKDLTPPPFSVTADDRTNSLVVSTTPSYFALVEELLKQLDQAPVRSNRDVQYFVLKNADAFDVALQLDRMFEDRKEDVPVIESDFFVNAITVIASKVDLATISQVIAKIDKSAEDNSRQVRVIPMEKMRAAKMAAVIKKIYEQTSNNKVVITEKVKPPADGDKDAKDSSNGERKDGNGEGDKKKGDGGAATQPDTREGGGGGGNGSGGGGDSGGGCEEEDGDDATKKALDKLLKGADGTPPKVKTVEVKPDPSGKPTAVSIAVDEATNSLIISGTRQQLDEIESLIFKFSLSSDETDKDFRIFTVKHADPQTVANIINSLFNPNAGKQQNNNRSNNNNVQAQLLNLQQQMMNQQLNRFGLQNLPPGLIPGGNPGNNQGTGRGNRRGNRGGGNQGNNQRGNNRRGGGAPQQPIIQGPTVTVVADTRTNRVIVRANPTDLDLIEELIERIDKPSSFSNEVRIFTLKNTNATDVAKNLSELINPQTSGRKANERRAILIRKKLEKEVQKATGSNEPVDMGTVLSVSANTATNSVIVVAPGDAMVIVAQIVEQLDQSAADATKPSVRMYPVKNADLNGMVTNLRSVFAPMMNSKIPGQPNVVITGDVGANVLIVSALPDQHVTIAQVIKDLDTAQPGEALSVRVYKVQYADASSVANTLSQTLIPGGQATQINPRTLQWLRGPRGNQRTANSSAAQGSAALRIVADTSSNVLVVRAMKEEHAQIEELLKQIDVPPSTHQLVNVIQLQYADAEKVAATLTKMFSEDQGTNNRRGPRFLLQAQQRQGIVIQGDRDSRMVIVRSDEKTFARIKDLAMKMDKAGETDRMVRRVILLKHAQAPSVANALTQAFAPAQRSGARLNGNNTASQDPNERVVVTAEPGTNSLVVTASAENHKKIDSLIATLDTETNSGTVNDFLILQNVNATELAPAMQSVASNVTQGQQRTVVSADRGSNALVLNGPAADVKRIMELASKIDQNASLKMKDGVFILPVKNGDAASYASTIQTLFTQKLLTSGGRTGPNTPTLAVSSDARSNSLVISTDAMTFLQIQKLVQQMDNITPTKGKMRVITLKNADPEDVRRAIEAIYGTNVNVLPQRSGGNLQGGNIPRNNGGNNNFRRGGGNTGRGGNTGNNNRRGNNFNRGGNNIRGIPNIPNRGGNLNPTPNRGNRGATRTPNRGGANPNRGGSTRLRGGNTGGNPRGGRGNGSGSGGGSSSGADSGGPVTVTSMTQQRALLIQADDADFEAIKKLAEMMDKAAEGTKKISRVVVLKHASNAKIATALNQLYAAAARTNAPEDRVIVTALTGTDALLIAAVAEKLPEVEMLIAKLDVKDLSPQLEFRIHKLKNATPSKILPTLNSILQKVQTDRQGEAIDIQADDRTRSLIITAKGTLFDKIIKIIETLDQTSEHAGVEVAVIQLKKADATRLAGILNEMLKPNSEGAVTPEARALQEQIKKLKIQVKGGKGFVELDLTKPIRITADPQEPNIQGSNGIVIASTAQNIIAMRSIIELMDRVPIADEVKVQIVHVENADVDSVRQTLEDIFAQGVAKLSGKTGSSVEGKAEPTKATGRALTGPFNVSVDLRTNSLVIAGREESLELARQIIEDLDREHGKFITEVRLFQLKHAEATTLAPLLSAVFAETEGATAGLAGLQTQVTRLRTVLDKKKGDKKEAPKAPDKKPTDKKSADPKKPNGSKTSKVAKPREALTIQADPATQTLIVAARSDVMPLIADVIKTLDVPGAGSGNEVRVVPLVNADATRIKQMLDALYTGENAQLIRAADRPTVQVDTRTNTLVIWASKTTFAVLSKLLTKLDAKQIVDLLDIRIIPLKNAEAAQLATTLQNAMDARVQRQTTLGVKDAESLRVLIVADPRSNGLIVSGSPESFKLVESLATKLDNAGTALAGQIQLYPLKQANAGTLAATLQNLFNARYDAATSDDVKRQRPVILPDLRSNALLVSAIADDTKVLVGLLKKMDVKLTNPAVQLVVLPLKHNDAGVIGPSIQRIFQARLQSMTAAGQTPTPQDQVNVETDSLSNALIVSASKENLTLIGELLKKVDVDPPSETGIVRMYPLKNADAQRVSTMLRSLIEQGLYKPGSAAAQDNAAVQAREKVAIEVDTRINVVIVSASKENFAVIEQIIKSVDSSDAYNILGDIRVFMLKHSDATRLGPTLQQFFDAKRAAEQQATGSTSRSLAVSITADARTNALLVAGSRESFAAVEAMVKKLDVVDTAPASEFRIFSLAQATAATLQPTLQQLFDQRVARGQTKDAVTILADSRANALIVGAAAEDMRLLEGLVKKLDAKPDKMKRSTKVFPLKKADANLIAATVRNLYSAEGANANTGVVVSVDERVNAIVVTGGPADLQRIGDLVAQLDSPTVTRVAEIKVFTLENAEAADLAQVLTDTLTTKPNEPSGITSNRQTLLQYIADSGKGKKVALRALQEGVLITPDERTNSLVVSAPVDYMPMLAKLIKGLDETSPREAEIRVYNLKNADAAQMATIIQQVFKLEATTANTDKRAIRYTLVSPVTGKKGSPSAVVGSAEEYALTVTVDTRTNSLIVGGTPKYVDLCSNMINQLDATPAQERTAHIYRLRHAQAVDIQTALRAFLDQERAAIQQSLGADGVGAAQRLLEREVSIVAEETSNTLLVSASPRYFKEIDDLISKLDEPKPQVLVQVTLAEVALSNSKDLGFEWQYTEQIGDSTIVAGTDFGVQQAIQQFGGLGVSVTGGDLSFFIRALQSTGKLEILSRPQILASDNQEATINVGQRVPFITNSQITDEGNTVNTIQYEDVGIILTVTARLTDDGFIHMDVNPEISSIADSTVRISDSVNAIIVNNRSAETTVTVQDGHTIVIGGLITTTDQTIEDRVPVISDLPLFGSLFKSTSVTKERTELLIILTPRILRDVKEADAATKDEIDRYKDKSKGRVDPDEPANKEDKGNKDASSNAKPKKNADAKFNEYTVDMLKPRVPFYLSPLKSTSSVNAKARTATADTKADTSKSSRRVSFDMKPAPKRLNTKDIKVDTHRKVSNSDKGRAKSNGTRYINLDVQAGSESGSNAGSDKPKLERAK